MKTPVQVWRASDGSIHECLGDANRAEARVETVKRLTEIFEAQEHILLDRARSYQLAKYLCSEEGEEVVKLLRDLELA